jgi:hypothetical protein
MKNRSCSFGAVKRRHLLPLVLLAVVAGVSAEAAGGDGGAPAALETSFFRLSPMRVEPLSGGTAVRYSVTVSNAPVGNAPYFRWYLRLTPPPSPLGNEAVATDRTRSDCANRALFGRKQLSAGRYVWENLGPTFVWRGSRFAECRGTISVLAENDQQHCTATTGQLGAAAHAGVGAPATCGRGGYLFGPSTYPVPRALLVTYARVDEELGQLATQVRQGSVRTEGELRDAVDRILQRQNRALSRLFPPVWGCSFDSVFGPLALAEGVLATALDDPVPSRQAATSRLAAASRSLARAAGSLAGCRKTQRRWWGAPAATVRSVRALAARADALRARVARGELAASRVPPELGTLRSSLDATLRDRFPPVFGVPYLELVRRLVVQRAAVAAAGQAAGAADLAGASAALEQAMQPVRTTRRALQNENRRLTKLLSNG